jgi:uncharacterized membrane protein
VSPASAPRATVQEDARPDGRSSGTTPAAAGRAAAAPRLLASAEGRILAAGLLLSTLMLAGFGIGWLFAPEATLVLAAMTGLNLLIGRAAGLSFGFAQGIDHVAVIGCNMLVETLQVLIVYPLFALSWQQLLDVPRLRPLLARVRGDAAAHEGWIRRFGIVGLFVFVFVPFWMTGPVVGAIIGFLIGLRARLNLAVVLAATYVAIVAWAVLLGQLHELTATFNRWALFAAIAAIAVLALAWRLLARRRR